MAFPRFALFAVPLLGLLGLLGFLLLAAIQQTTSPRFPPTDSGQILSLDIFSLPPLFAPAAEFTGAANIQARSQPVLLTVWASWCAPCRAEHPVLMDLAARPDVLLVGVAYKDAPDNARHFLHELGNPYALALLDESGAAMLNWGLLGVPESFLISPAGELLWRHFGPLTDEAVAAELLPALMAFATPASPQN